MNELHLFAGAGGGILAGQLLGHRCVGAVENEPYAQAVLVARQNDGTFPPFPIFGDVREFDGRPWRGIVDIVAGGFPCQDISSAGTGAGIEGKRSGLWSEMARIVREVRPRYVFVENSPLLASRGLNIVLGDLAAMGLNAEWCVLGADDLGAPHRRKRIWILAHATSIRQSRQRESVLAGDTEAHKDREAGHAEYVCVPPKWPAEPGVGRVVDGMAHRSHRLTALGNGQVPRVAAAAFVLLAHRLGTTTCFI